MNLALINLPFRAALLVWLMKPGMAACRMGSMSGAQEPSRA